MSDLEVRYYRKECRIRTELAQALHGSTSEQARWIDSTVRALAWEKVQEDLALEKQFRTEAREWLGV